MFVAVFLGFVALLPGFAKPDNLLTLLQNVAILGILGLGMAVVVIGRGIDLSMVASLAVPPGLILSMVQGGHSAGTALACGVALSLAFGLVNGWLIAFAEVPPLFTTLASGLFLSGLGQSVLLPIETPSWGASLDGLAWLGRGALAGVPMPVVTFAGTAILVGFMLRRTRLGAFIYAIGDNPLAARASGASVRPVLMAQYVLSAAIGAIAGAVMAASIGSLPTRIFTSSLIYDVILVVVLGGIGLTGGRGGVSNVLIGTLLIGTLLNGMTLLDVSFTVQNLIRGLILLIAIAAESFINPRNEETAQQGDL
ncbi:MAG TPA: ABC transporter permease [Burkholderiaceae bacterium]|nr:ABC transporter permease [Burkholderiaceae bacterium]